MTDAKFAIGLIGLPGETPLSPKIFGAKAAELSHMSRLGLPVPPAFALPATLCAPFLRGESGIEAKIRELLDEGVEKLEAATGRLLGDRRAPLLVSARSGAEKSMPGMLETILDLGLNRQTLHGLIRQSGNPRLGYDCWRRFLQLYAEVVGGAAPAPFEALLAQTLRGEGANDESELDPEALERLGDAFFALAASQDAAPPDDPREQLLAATAAVFRSWTSAKANIYRQINHLDNMIGTAVTVQLMVFGNSGGRSGSGVAFSRDPASGEKKLYLDFLFDAQGEDVVSGRRTPVDAERFKSRLPRIFAALEQGAEKLEAACADAQDIEFTIDNATLYFLQTRNAKRTPRAALKIAVDLAESGAISRAEALARTAEIDVAAAARRRFADSAETVATAQTAAPGVACGRAAFSSAEAMRLVQSGEPAILIRRDASTEDVAGFNAACGILTAIGGRTSHAAVVARQLGKCCLVGCAALSLDADGRGASLGKARVAAGDFLALDGATGEISLGRREIVTEAAPEAAILADWRAGSIMG